MEDMENSAGDGVDIDSTSQPWIVNNGEYNFAFYFEYINID